MSKKIGITLSGGGARAVAHLGLLKVLEEFGLKADVMSGTSGGAIAGAFYSAGYSIPEILKIIAKGHFFNFSNMLFKKQGLFAMNGFEEIYSNYFPANTFDDLKIPLYIAATDILKGEVVYFSEGNLSQALMASSCIPLVFQPVEYNNTLFVDGGVLNNFPIEPLENKCDILIGSYVNSINMDVKKIHMHDVVDRSVHLSLSSSVKLKAPKCKLFFEPSNMTRFSIVDTDRVQEIYDFGYSQALLLEKEIESLFLEN